MALNLPGDPAWPLAARVALGQALEYGEQMLNDYNNANRQNRKLLSRVSALETELASQTRRASVDAEVKAAFEYWVIMCHKNPKTTKLGKARVKALSGIFRMEFTLEDVKLAIDGAARFAYKDPKGKIHNDLTLVCRDEAKFQDFMERGERARALRDAEEVDRADQ